MTDRQQIESIITDMATLKEGKLQGGKHMTDSCVFIRPTGNPLSKKAWQVMMDSPDVSITHSSLVAINKIEVSGEMAYACYTTHGKFSYKGTENDDIAVLTAVFRKIDGIWKLIHGQRSSGRKPADPLPQF
jgi:ketosteroid isomerase-like protein